MKPILFAAGLLAALLPASTALARSQDPAMYATPEEAERHVPEVIRRCLDETGANTCVSALFASEGPEPPSWRSIWVKPSADFACVDRATADNRVACDAADAVRIVVWPFSANAYRTPEEGRLRAPLPPSDCLDQTGANTCALGFMTEEDEESIRWRPVWRPASELDCVDGATADHRVDCDAPDAVRIWRGPPIPRVPAVAPRAPSSAS